jgi:protein TonB
VLASAQTDTVCLGCRVGDEGGSDVGAHDPGPGDTGAGGGGELVAPLRVSSGVDAPAKLVHVDPRYPDLAMRARVHGAVVLECVIDPAGGVVEVEIKSGHPLLRAAAVEAVRRWRYSPTRLNGVPVPVILTVTVHFRLQPTTR